MSFDAEPIVGGFYTDTDNEIDFEVIAIDDYEGLVEIKREDGDIDQVTLDDWYDMSLEPKDPDEEWNGMIDLDDDSGDDEPGYEQEYLD
jgi:hypothetical protein